MSIIVADARQNTDGAMYRLLENVSCKVPIVLMSRTHDFRFNEDLRKLDAFVLAEVGELGWDWPLLESHHWGVNTEKFPQYQNEEYKKFDEWVASKPPLLTLQRELLIKDVTDIRLPIDYPCWYNVIEAQSKKTFDGRPIHGFYFWGRSHEARLRLHSQMWTEASRRGFSVCDNPSFFDKFVMEEKGDLFVSMWMPHYGRKEMSEILEMQQLAKVSIALPGAGIKTFRHAESSYNAVMLKWKDELAWSYSWTENNCILSSEGEEINDVFLANGNPQLYEIYCNGIENCRRYQADIYAQNYLNPILARI